MKMNNGKNKSGFKSEVEKWKTDHTNQGRNCKR